MSLAGATTDYELDGRVIPFADTSIGSHAESNGAEEHEKRVSDAQSQHHTVAEYWLYGSAEGKYNGREFLSLFA